MGSLTAFPTYGGAPRPLRDVAANRPAAGAIGRLYIETDSPYKVWRDNGAGWDHIGFGVTPYHSGYAGETRSAERPPQPLVTFVHDDGWDTVYTNMLPLFNAKGVVGVVAMVSDFIDTAGKLSLAQLTEMYNSGWEVASHSKTHPHLPLLTEAQIIAELADSKSALEAHGFEVTNFAYPYNEHNALVRRLTRRYYRSARAILIGSIPANPWVLPTYALYGWNCDTPGDLAAWQIAVDEAESLGRWLIFYFHGTDAADVAAIGTLIDYIQAKSISIVTLEQGLDLVGNTIDVGDHLEEGTSASEGGLRTYALGVGGLPPNDVGWLEQTFANNVYGCLRGTVNSGTAYHCYFVQGQRARAGGLVTSGDQLLRLEGLGHDGSNYESAGKITIEVDYTTGLNDMPGRICCYTTPDGAITSVERLRIDSVGYLWLNAGVAKDTNLYRSAANLLKTDDEFWAVGPLGLTDGIAAPGATVGRAKLYVDTADGDLKVVFGDGVIKTIAVDV